MAESSENRLKKLVQANSEENRYEWARKWKAGGKPVAAMLCSYVPREALYAAGFLPWRVTGVWAEATPLALLYRPSWSTPRNTRILELALRDDLDFVDALVGTDWDIDLKRLWDEWAALKKPKLAHLMFVPRFTTELHQTTFRQSIAKLMAAIEASFGIKVSPQALNQAIHLYKEMRELIKRMYELRKREVPAVSGAEALGITTAALVMPPGEFNAELRELLPYLETRRAPLASYQPRLLVSSDFLDDLRYLELVEDTGCVVAMDDLDTGSRYFLTGPEESASDPLMALAKGYLERPGCPRMADWDEQISQVREWVKEFNIDGVLELRLNYSMIRHMRSPFLKSAMEDAGIPFVSLPREHHFANESQLRTRIGALVEILQDA
ncbi:MAG: Benzoyl-CoA reductase/2-hydroxyglutaryl-CoA dehydratase subunit, BcrC/BadD/HgdB [Dehalococcoidales bacterium]|nr:Benzoyl-CoA reductase/2-hydroxyglutaryl-CoA dehydratase subunit, BcrC/BadD/HgdB [Dehalococcoidales bacterium]